MVKLNTKLSCPALKNLARDSELKSSTQAIINGDFELRTP